MNFFPIRLKFVLTQKISKYMNAKSNALRQVDIMYAIYRTSKAVSMQYRAYKVKVGVEQLFF